MGVWDKTKGAEKKTGIAGAAKHGFVGSKYDPIGYKLLGGEKADKEAEAADKALAAQKQEAADTRQFIKDQASRGAQYIDKATYKAGQNIGQGYAQGKEDLTQGYHGATGALGQGYEGATSSLGQGYDQARQDIGATPNRMADLYGGGLASSFQADPGYRFRLQQGQDAIEHAASAAGGRHGGDTLKALAEYNQNFASNEFNNYAQRQMGMAQGADAGDFARNSYLGNLSQAEGQGLSGLSMSQGQNLANLSSSQGSNLANLSTSQGNNMANLYMGGATTKANNAIGAAGQYASLTPAMMQAYNGPVQYAGGAAGATNNNLLQLGATAAGYYFGGPVGGAAANQAAGYRV